jgi:hypothetical protein
LGSDGFDTRPDDDASPLLIQRTVTLLLFFFGAKIRTHFKDATQF